MKSDAICPVCGAVLERVHQYEKAERVSRHILDEHPADFLKIARVNKLTDVVWEKYKIHVSDLFYYSVNWEGEEPEL